MVLEMLSSRSQMVQSWKLVTTKTAKKLTLSQKLMITNTSRLVMGLICSILTWFFGRPVVQTVRLLTFGLRATILPHLTANRITPVPLLNCLMELSSLNLVESWTQATLKIQLLLLVKKSICASPIETATLNIGSTLALVSFK